MGPEGLRDLGRSRPGVPAVAGEPVLAARFDLSAPEPGAEQRPGQLRRRLRRESAELPARQLLDVPAPHDVLHERALRARPASSARRLCAPQSRRRLDQHDHAAEPGHPVPEHPGQQRLRQLPRHPVPADAQPGDGRLPQHGHLHQEQPERELRARDHAAVLDRYGPAQPGRHDAERPDLGSAPARRYDQSVIDNLKLVFTGWKIPNVTVPPLAGDSGDNGQRLHQPDDPPDSNHSTLEKDLFVQDVPDAQPFLPDQNGNGAPTIIAAGGSGTRTFRRPSTPSSITRTSARTSPGSSSTAS